MMNIGDACVSTWLWTMTWGLYYAPISFIVMSLLLWCATDIRFLTSVFWSLCAVLSSYALFYAYVVFVLMRWCGNTYIPYDAYPACPLIDNSLHPIYVVMIAYFLCEFFFFRFTPLWKKIATAQMIAIVLFSNIVTGCLVYGIFCK